MTTPHRAAAPVAEGGVAPERGTQEPADSARPLAASDRVAARVGRYRWTVCALLFAATTINYLDRQTTGVLAPTLQREFGWTETQYADITSYWTAAYALGFMFVGRFIDRVGVRAGFAAAVLLWSAAAAAHGLAHSVLGFAAARFALGIGESGNFPAAIKATAEWFPRHERALATGVFNAGTNVGAVATAVLVPWLTLAYGWRTAFAATGLLGLAWLAVWLPVYRPPAEHPRLGAAERGYIEAGREGEGESADGGAPRARVRWLTLLRYRQTWAFAVGKLMTDGVWWFYLFWLPKFLDARYGIKLGKLAVPLIIIYVVADFGSVFGGWLSGALIGSGWGVARARKAALLAAALLIVPTALTPAVTGVWGAVALVSLAAAAHQWWSANVFTLSSDMFPRGAVASVVGLGGFAGAAGAVLFQRATGAVLQANGGDYRPIFFYCGLAYVTALAIMHRLAPRLEPVRLDGA